MIQCVYSLYFSKSGQPLRLQRFKKRARMDASFNFTKLDY